LHPCDLHVAAGELFVLVGPSGAGKTTLLRLVAGLETPDGGRILFNGQPVGHLPPHRRGLSFTPQKPALFPDRTVAENLAFGMGLRREPRAEVAARVRRAAELLRITHLLPRAAQGLSLGEQHRVALGRGLVRRAGLWLLDEPLGALDPALRQELKEELLLLQRSLGATMIYVTHDPIDGLALGRRIGVLADGRLQQSGEPGLLYRRPGNLRVASCLGWPPANLVPGRAERDGDGTRFRPDVPAPPLSLPGRWPGRLVLGFRAEDAAAGTSPPPGALVLAGWAVALAEPVGRGCSLTLERGGARLRVWHPGREPPAAWDGWVAAERLMIFDETTGDAVNRPVT
ncbi:MAG TPA: ABC transporter ATP-binding protein, partial [Gemmataceae bacterium]